VYTARSAPCRALQHSVSGPFDCSWQAKGIARAGRGGRRGAAQTHASQRPVDGEPTETQRAT